MTGQFLLGVKGMKTDSKGKEDGERVLEVLTHSLVKSNPSVENERGKKRGYVYMLKYRVRSFQPQGCLLHYDKLMKTQQQCRT